MIKNEFKLGLSFEMTDFVEFKDFKQFLSELK